MSSSQKLTDFTPQRVELNSHLMWSIDLLVHERPHPDTMTSKQEDDFLGLVSDAMDEYYDAGRRDVDQDSEYIEVTLRDMYRDAYSVGMQSQGLRQHMINGVVEVATSYPR